MIGERWFKSLREEPWTVERLSEDGKRVVLRRGHNLKSILVSSLKTTYVLEGSQTHKLTLEAYKRHGWEIWNG